MWNICLRYFCSQTVIFDLPQCGTRKKNKKNRSILGPKQRKTSLIQLRIFPSVTQVTNAWNFQCKKRFWKSFVLKLWCWISLKPALAKLKESEYFDACSKENFPDAVEKSCLCIVDTFLKVSLQEKFLAICDY